MYKIYASLDFSDRYNFSSKKNKYDNLASIFNLISIFSTDLRPLNIS